MKRLLLISFVIVMSSCVSQSEYDKLQQENKRLTEELEECQNGAEKLVATINKSYSEKNYTLAKENIALLYEKHPEAPENKEFKKLLISIEKEELAEIKRKEAEEKERIRLENLNNTGMWDVGYYVDEFGEPTKEAYIYNKSPVMGTFSNSATENSMLRVSFLISNSGNIALQLYEYNRNNPVKAYSPDYYTVQVQDKDGNRIKLEAVNFSERLRFNPVGSKKIHNVLLKGGKVMFRIFENENPINEYKFDLQNADWYENAYRKLKES